MTSGADGLYEVLRHVRPLHQYSAKAVADALAEHDVTMPMRAVLERLADGAQTVPQVARALWLPRQVVQRLTDTAAAQGYVRYVANPAHRRSKLAELTDAGRRVFDGIHDRELADLGALADRLDPGDIAACVRVISALTTHTREVAQRRGDDHGWSTPGPRPGEEIR
jgi:DNA-binding MarR family transcriptional regulator